MLLILGRVLGDLYPAKAIPKPQQACEEEEQREGKLGLMEFSCLGSMGWQILVQGKEQGVVVWPGSLSAQQGHGDSPHSAVPLLWFQQFITPVRPPASSATTATASRSAGRATGTPTARTALMRTLPPVVTCPVGVWGALPRVGGISAHPPS